MRAIRVHDYGPPERMHVEEIPTPAPGPGEILVRVKAAGVNPVETYQRAGTQGYRPALPFTPGTDAAGVVERVGTGVKGFAPGDRVYVAGSKSGTYADRCLCAELQVHPLPEALSFEQGAAIGVPCVTAYRALFDRARSRAGEWVLVHGASGAVGLAAVQLALAHGMQVVGTAGSETGRTLVAAQGVPHVLDHHDPAHLDAAQTLTEGQGLDVIVEMLAHVNLGRDLGVLAAGGRVVVVGSRGTVEVTPRDLMRRDASVFGMSLANLSAYDRARIHESLGESLRSGSLRPVVDRAFSLDQAPEAHHAVHEGPSHGKIVLVP